MVYKLYIQRLVPFAKKEIKPVVKICIMHCYCHNYAAKVINILRNQNCTKPFLHIY